VRALITGGAGFIGSHLSDMLLEQGHEVLILDNLSTGSIDNIAHLKGRPGFEYFIDTVNNEGLLAELIDRSDVVFHFAAAVGVKLIVEQPVYTIETNVHGTEVVLKHANKKKKLVVIASTSPPLNWSPPNWEVIKEKIQKRVYQSSCECTPSEMLRSGSLGAKSRPNPPSR